MEMTQAQYAKHIGASRQYVNKLVKTKRIPVTKAGKINAAEADYALQRHADPARELAKENAAATPAAGAPDDGPSFSKARAEREAYQAKIAELEYLERIGKLLPQDEVLDAVVRAGRRIRQRLDAITTWTDEICALNAESPDPAATRAYLADQVRKLEETISKALSNLSASEDDEEDA